MFVRAIWEVSSLRIFLYPHKRIFTNLLLEPLMIGRARGEGGSHFHA